jgi:hypothetical protein
MDLKRRELTGDLPADADQGTAALLPDQSSELTKFIPLVFRAGSRPSAVAPNYNKKINLS